jgi:hypothetical protein
MFVKADCMIHQFTTYDISVISHEKKQKKTHRSASVRVENDVNDPPQSAVIRRWAGPEVKSPRKVGMTEPSTSERCQCS